MAVIGVVGGSGGVGASTFAAVLAAAAGDSLLVDLDVVGGGIDVLLGLEGVAGARWSGLRLAGGHLDAAVLLGGLPRWGRSVVLAADQLALNGDDVTQVLDAASPVAPVVLDLPRSPGAARAAAVRRCDLVVLMARADVGGLVAAHAVAASMGDAAVGLVVRRGEVRPAEAARLVGVALVGELPAVRVRPPLSPQRLPRAETVLARGLVRGLAVAPAIGRPA